MVPEQADEAEKTHEGRPHPPDPALTGGGDHHNTSPLSQNHNTDSNSSGGPLKSESPVGGLHDNV